MGFRLLESARCKTSRRGLRRSGGSDLQWDLRCSLRGALRGGCDQRKPLGERRHGQPRCRCNRCALWVCDATPLARRPRRDVRGPGDTRRMVPPRLRPRPLTAVGGSRRRFLAPRESAVPGGGHGRTRTAGKPRGVNAPNSWDDLADESAGKRRGRDLNPRRTQEPETVFETAAFDRSATPPKGRTGYRALPAVAST
jgi:hypothetical protein